MILMKFGDVERRWQCGEVRGRVPLLGDLGSVVPKLSHPQTNYGGAFPALKLLF